METQTLNLPAAAAYLGVHPNSLRRIARRKAIAFMRPLGARGWYRFRRAWLDDYLERQCSRPARAA